MPRTPPKKTAFYIYFTERLQHFLIRSPLHRSETSRRQPDSAKRLQTPHFFVRLYFLTTRRASLRGETRGKNTSNRLTMPGMTTALSAAECLVSDPSRRVCADILALLVQTRLPVPGQFPKFDFCHGPGQSTETATPVPEVSAASASLNDCTNALLA